MRSLDRRTLIASTLKKGHLEIFGLFRHLTSGCVGALTDRGSLLLYWWRLSCIKVLDVCLILIIIRGFLCSLARQHRLEKNIGIFGVLIHFLKFWLVYVEARYIRENNFRYAGSLHRYQAIIFLLQKSLLQLGCQSSSILPVETLWVHLLHWWDFITLIEPFE